VDDVGLVIHADPPVEHKAYLHRSGRTARAGAAGSVVTLMLGDQVRDVRDLTRKAGISPKTTAVHPNHPLLGEIAPGERTFPGGYAQTPSAAQPARSGGPRRNGSRRNAPKPAASKPAGQGRRSTPRPGGAAAFSAGAGGSGRRRRG
ncbi:MAG: RNA helicase, partial [Actinomycetia bacterium]|nr:RNA helicase [Actinomycetes bacterium]